MCFIRNRIQLQKYLYQEKMNTKVNKVCEIKKEKLLFIVSLCSYVTTQCQSLPISELGCIIVLAGLKYSCIIRYVILLTSG
jgi:hypothetical protein